MKRAKQKCNRNAPVPLIPFYGLSNLIDVMKIFGFLTGSPPLMSCHNMMSLDNSVRPLHCFWSTKVNDLHQFESRHQIFCWKCVASPVQVQLSSLQVSQLTITRARNRHWQRYFKQKINRYDHHNYIQVIGFFLKCREATCVSQILFRWSCCRRSWVQRSLHYRQR